MTTQVRNITTRRFFDTHVRDLKNKEIECRSLPVRAGLPTTSRRPGNLKGEVEMGQVAASTDSVRMVTHLSGLMTAKHL